MLSLGMITDSQNIFHVENISYVQLPVLIRCFRFFCQFTSDARDCESYLRQLQETIKRQYTCDKNSRLSKLEDLLQDSMVSTQFLSQLPRDTNFMFQHFMIK